MGTPAVTPVLANTPNQDDSPRRANIKSTRRLKLGRAPTFSHKSLRLPGYPIESAFMGDSPGWRADHPGTQIVRIIFDRPQTLRRIWLLFEDSENARTQEFVLRWSGGQESSFREIVRQPWNFSPGGSVRENEDYTVHLPEVGTLELIIVPDKSGDDVRASPRSFRVA
jgi:hypothetical protein